MAFKLLDRYDAIIKVKLLANCVSIHYFKLLVEYVTIDNIKLLGWDVSIKTKISRSTTNLAVINQYFKIYKGDNGKIYNTSFN